MAFEINWSIRAEANLDQIFRYIKKNDSEFSASKFITKISERVRKLAARPTWIGLHLHISSDRSDSGPWYITVSSYKIIYDVVGSRVEIIAIVHSRMQLSDFIGPRGA
jgi:plasmid stabilization system protein ParE